MKDVVKRQEPRYKTRQKNKLRKFLGYFLRSVPVLYPRVFWTGSSMAIVHRASSEFVFWSLRSKSWGNRRGVCQRRVILSLQLISWIVNHSRTRHLQSHRKSLGVSVHDRKVDRGKMFTFLTPSLSGARNRFQLPVSHTSCLTLFTR